MTKDITKILDKINSEPRFYAYHYTNLKTPKIKGDSESDINKKLIKKGQNNKSYNNKHYLLVSIYVDKNAKNPIKLSFWMKKLENNILKFDYNFTLGNAIWYTKEYLQKYGFNTKDFEMIYHVLKNNKKFNNVLNKITMDMIRTEYEKTN